jgi:hypothetical protein
VGDLFINPGVVGAVAAAIVLSVLLSTGRSATREVGGRHVVEYARPLKVFVGVCWMFWLGVAIAALFASPKDRLPALALVAGFLLLIVPLHLEFVRVRVEFDDDGITTRSPWRAARSIPWSAVERAWFSQAMQWYVVETKGFGRVRLHIYLSGIQSFVVECEARKIPVSRRPGT